MNLLNRLAGALPMVRRLAEDNRRLCSRIEEVDSQLQQCIDAARGLEGAVERCSELEAENTRLRTEQREDQTRRVAQELWVPPGHFYSPIVDPADEAVQRAIESEANPSAVPEAFGIRADEVLRWFGIIAGYYVKQPFPELATAGWRYHYSNPLFPLADALALLAFMCTRPPKRFVEIGAGFSSCAAIDINDRYLNGAVEMMFVEPHAELAVELIGRSSPYQDALLRKKLQDLPLDTFRRLEADDILFIDSSHVAKTGSDVLDYIFRVLPSLRPGVRVHIHDIFSPSSTRRRGSRRRTAPGMRRTFCGPSCTATPLSGWSISPTGFTNASATWSRSTCPYA